MQTHFEVLRHRQDGSFALASSALTGQTWDGSLWVFKSVQDFAQCVNLLLTNTKTSAGVSDMLWLPWDKEDRLLVASDSGELDIWSCGGPMSSLELEWQASLKSHDDMALCVCALGGAGGGGKVVSGGADGRVIIWDVPGLKQLRNFRAHNDMVLSIAPSPEAEHTFIASSQDGTVRLWDLRAPKPAKNITACRRDVYSSLAWGEECLAMGSESGVLEVFDVKEGSCTSRHGYQAHDRCIHRMTFAPWDSDLLASVSDDKKVKVHSIADSKILYESEEHTDFVRGVSWDPLSRDLVTCGWDNRVLQHSNLPTTVATKAVSPERSTEPSEPEPSEPEPSEGTAMVVEKGVVSSTICHSKLGNGYATTHPIHSNMEQ